MAEALAKLLHKGHFGETELRRGYSSCRPYTNSSSVDEAEDQQISIPKRKKKQERPPI
jgi:hypothetical protein